MSVCDVGGVCMIVGDVCMCLYVCVFGHREMFVCVYMFVYICVCLNVSM